MDLRSKIKNKISNIKTKKFNKIVPNEELKIISLNSLTPSSD